MIEVGPDVWVARHEYLDVNAGIVGGSRGLVVVDTLWSPEAAEALLDRARQDGIAGEVVAVVNTHAHFDHVRGNPYFTDAFGSPVHAHEDAAAAMLPLPVSNPFSSIASIDLGDRLVEVIHPGRGHTAGDVVVRVADSSGVDVLFAGDLVEAGAPPSYGEDSFPLEWPLTLDLLESLLSTSTAVVPGHGAVVDKAFVEAQRAAIGVVAETIRDLASRGVPVASALGAAEWPFPREMLADAVRLGYAQLPRSARSLPLL